MWWWILTLLWDPVDWVTFKIIHEIWITAIRENDTNMWELLKTKLVTATKVQCRELRKLLKFCGDKEEQDINHGGRVEENPLTIGFCKKEGRQAVNTGVEFPWWNKMDMATQARLTLFLLNLVLGPAQDGPAQILYWLCVSSFPSILNTWWDLLNDNAFLPSSRYGTCAAIFFSSNLQLFCAFFLRHLGVEPKQKCL